MAGSGRVRRVLRSPATHLGVAVVVVALAILALGGEEPVAVVSSNAPSTSGVAVSTSTPLEPSTTVEPSASATTTLAPATTAAARRAPEATTTTFLDPEPVPVCADDAPTEPPRGIEVVGAVTDAAIREFPVDGSEPYTVPGTEDENWVYDEAVWSPDHRRVAYTRTRNRSPQDGTQESQLTVVDLVTRCWIVVARVTDATLQAPRWSPQGDRITYSTVPRYSQPRPIVVLSIIDADGGGRRQLADMWLDGAEWAPDGSDRLAITTTDGLTILELGTGKRTVLNPAPDSEFPQWSPDASRLVFSISTNSGVWIAEADGSASRRITGQEPIYWSQWSPDGSRIAFAAGQLETVRADGTDRRRLATAGHNLPFWSPDGTRVAYHSSTWSNGFDISVIDAAGGEPRRLATNASIGAYFVRR